MDPVSHNYGFENEWIEKCFCFLNALCDEKEKDESLDYNKFFKDCKTLIWHKQTQMTKRRHFTIEDNKHTFNLFTIQPVLV